MNEPTKQEEAQTGSGSRHDRMVMLPDSLTAENGSKYLLSGEFSETITRLCEECLGEDDCCDICGGAGEVLEYVPVEWTTIKAIYQKIVEHYTAT